MLIAPIPHTAAELCKRRCKSMHRVVGRLRIGDVSLDPVHCETPGQGTTPANLDHVAGDLFARRFADDAPVDPFGALHQYFDHPLRAIDRRTFLVAGNQEGDSALMMRTLGDEGLGGRDHRGQSAFHVRRAAPVERAGANVRFERIGTPVFQRSSGHHVSVSRKAQHRVPLTARCPQVVDCTKAQLLDAKAEGFKARRNEILAALIGGRDRVSRDQVPGQLKRGGHGVRAVRSYGVAKGQSTTRLIRCAGSGGKALRAQ